MVAIFSLLSLTVRGGQISAGETNACKRNSHDPSSTRCGGPRRCATTATSFIIEERCTNRWVYTFPLYLLPVMIDGYQRIETLLRNSMKIS